jgi:hypothetical protein
MTVYVNSANRDVYLEVPVTANPGTMDITIYEDTVLQATVDTVTYDAVNGRYVLTLPFSLVQSDKILSINWQFQYTENNSTFEFNEYTYEQIITPILPISTIKSIIDNDDDSDAAEVESAVRNIIQAHTGQFFGKIIGTMVVTGSGAKALKMPYRLVQLNSINGLTSWDETFTVKGAGWFIEPRTFGVPTVRADFQGWNDQNPYPPGTWMTGGVISAPQMYRQARGFIENVSYQINAVWGYNFVPQAVQEAAKLLVNDYACGDSIYRDRFITAVQAADWRLQFSEGAFAATGNIRADQLLEPFVLRRGWLVV